MVRARLGPYHVRGTAAKKDTNQAEHGPYLARQNAGKHMVMVCFILIPRSGRPPLGCPGQRDVRPIEKTFLCVGTTAAEMVAHRYRTNS